MKNMIGYYSIVQYCPDPSRQESANVGIVLFCPEINFLKVRTTKGNDRIRRFFRNTDIDRGQLNMIKMSIQRRLEIDREDFTMLSDLEKFAATRANAMRLTNPKEVPIEAGANPDPVLDRLFDRLVGGRVKNDLPPVKDALDEAFRAESVTHYMKRKVVVTIPQFNRQITVPYGFQNGRFNLIQPARFQGLDSTSIMERAGKFALEGNLLYNAPDDRILGSLKMVVVGQFADNQSGVSHTVSRFLKENNTELYRTDQIDELVEVIRTTGKVS